MSFISERLRSIEQKGLTRSLRVHNASVDLSSNDYLGLARSGEFKARYLEALAHQPGQGSSGSRLLTGNSKAIEDLEERIAAFHGSESALLFPTGFMANAGLMQALAQRGDTIIRDEHCHASTIDPLRGSLATVLKFRHNNLEDLERKLQTASGEIFVATEALFSMQGDMPDLPSMVALCEKYEAHLLMDEAHSVGIYGMQGRGWANELGLESRMLARVVTYGKAFGYQGGAILCSRSLKQLLVNTCRPFIFSTGMSMHQVLGISIAYDLVSAADQERKQLRSVIDQFIQMREMASADWLPSSEHIQGRLVGDNAAVMALAEQCVNANLLVLPIRRPSVPEGSEMLRITLHAYNTPDELGHLFKTLAA